MNLPAICDNCGFVFPSGFVVEGTLSINLKGNVAGPCPTCGFMGHIPDGRFNIMNNIMEVLEAPECTVKDLKLLAKIFKNAKEDEVSIDSVIEEIEDNVPNLSNITQFLPQTREEKRDDFKFLIGILLSIITIIITLKVGGNEQSNDIDIESIISNIYKMQQEDINIDMIGFPSGKIGRNVLCPCGSGIKYKYCHLKRSEESESNSNYIELK